MKCMKSRSRTFWARNECEGLPVPEVSVAGTLVCRPIVITPDDPDLR